MRGLGDARDLAEVGALERVAGGEVIPPQIGPGEDDLRARNDDLVGAHAVAQLAGERDLRVEQRLVGLANSG